MWQNDNSQLGHKLSLINHSLYKMSAHVLLTLLNELGKSDKIRDLPSIVLLFRNEFNKFNNTGAQMLYSIYHMTVLIKNCSFGVLPSFAQRYNGRNNISQKPVNH